MNAEFEKYWKSSRASDRPFAETNAQILDKMIAKTHFLAGAAAMREKDEKALCANCKAEGLNVRCDLCTDIAAIRKVSL